MKSNWILAVATALGTSLGASAVHADSSDVLTVSDAVTQFTSFGGGGAKDGCDGCSKGCDSCEISECEPWRLFPEIGCGWETHGWLAVGGTANAGTAAARFNGPVSFNDRNRVQVNQLYASFGRDADNDGCGFAWGARVDAMFGTDFIFTQAVGLELDQTGASHWSRAGEQYGLAVPQFYGEFAYNNLSLKVGHFYTIIGYETVTAPDNFFYSHAYTMQYGEPFTHTGGLLSYQLGERFELHGGLVNGWDKFDAVTDKLAFLGGVTYTPCHERYSLAFAGIIGQEDGSGGAAGLATRSMYSVVFDWHITDRLEYVFQHDMGYDDSAPSNEWYGMNNYLFYTLNECWKVGARWEWFRDDDGSRVSAAPVRAGGLAGPLVGLTQAQAATLATGNYYAVSAGLNWSPTSNIIVRPEARWDWADEGRNIYDGLTDDSQFLGAFDVIVLY